MKFYKGCESFSFFLSTYGVFFLHILLVYCTDDKSCEESDEKINTTLIMHKRIFFFFFIFTFFAHLITSLSDPGAIENENYLEMLESYNYIYKEINDIKKKYKQAHEDDEDYYPDETNSLSLSSEEDNDVPINNKITITKKKQKIIAEKYDFEVSKCTSCNVMRPSDTHHCSDCHICVMDRENHCPWMNNCVGLFNRKSYLLFCMYASISVVYSFMIYFYYKVIKNFSYFRESLSDTLIGIFWMFFCFIYGGFCMMLLKDERKSVIKEFQQYRSERVQLMKLKMRIIFGGHFSMKWFFPCFSGGNKKVFSYLKKKSEDDFKSKKFKKVVIKKN